jgi:hypothetical protein
VGDVAELKRGDTVQLTLDIKLLIDADDVTVKDCIEFLSRRMQEPGYVDRLLREKTATQVISAKTIRDIKGS